MVSEDGLVATNQHVIQDAHSASVIFPDGSKYRMERIVLSLRSRDLALLKIRGRQFPYLRLAEDALPAVLFRVGMRQGVEQVASLDVEDYILEPDAAFSLQLRVLLVVPREVFHR